MLELSPGSEANRLSIVCWLSYLISCSRPEQNRSVSPDPIETLNQF